MLTSRAAPVQLLLTLAALYLGAFVMAGEPRVSDEQKAPEAIDFGKMTEAQAKTFDGKRITVRARIVKEHSAPDGRVYYQCRGDGDVTRFIILKTTAPIRYDQAKRKVFTFEGRLWVYLPTIEQKSGQFWPSDQFALLDARVIE
jgi:hypothetical protein